MLRKTYAEVDLDCIAHNIRALRRAAGTPVMAVVKADAYGHGMQAVARRALREGVDWFAVATADEAVALREVCPGHILLLSAAQEPEAEQALVRAGVSLCLYTPAQLDRLEETCRTLQMPANIHLKIDTGMNRIGLETMEELAVLLDRLHESQWVRLEGVFTHFATADEAELSFSCLQLERFLRAVAAVRQAGFTPICHASNSAAIIGLSAAHLDLCRMGIAMYGYAPSGEVDAAALNLRPALRLVSHITHVKEIAPGESVSYGRKFTAEKPERIATVAIGYADGYRRAFSNKAAAEWKGRLLPVVGRVCMDPCMFLATGTDARAGDEVTLLGRQVTAETLAGYADTISYEILTGLTARVPRVYVHA